MDTTFYGLLNNILKVSSIAAALGPCGIYVKHCIFLESIDCSGSDGTFRLDDESTWPDVPSGRPYSYTRKSGRWDSEYPIQLYDDHSECQAVCCAVVDSALDGRVHWGHDRTHWCLRPGNLKNILHRYLFVSFFGICLTDFIACVLLKNGNTCVGKCVC